MRVEVAGCEEIGGGWGEWGRKEGLKGWKLGGDGARQGEEGVEGCVSV